MVYSSLHEFTLRSGRVPAPRSQTIRRQRLLNLLNIELRHILENSERWLVVNGLVGCGKTQLVTDLLWEFSEISLVDFSRVIWLTDRNLSPKHLVDLAHDALVLLANPARDESTSILMEMSSMRDSDLRNFIGTKLSGKLHEFRPTDKILFILDGVMNVETIRFFSDFLTNSCYVVATTTNREIFAVLDSPRFFDVFNGYELHVDDWMSMARKFKVQISSTQLKELLYASGYNFALMEKAFQLASCDPEIISSLLHRISFRPLKEISCISHYHSVSLEEPLRQSFQMILKHFWPIDLCGQETDSEIDGMIIQDLQILHQHSLVRYYDGDNFLQIDRHIEGIQPVVFSFLIHNRPNGYEHFLDNVTAVITKLNNLAKEDRFYKSYLSENISCLNSLRRWADALLLAQRKKTQNQTYHQKERQQRVTAAGCLQSVFDLFVNLLSPTRVVRSFFNAFFHIFFYNDQVGKK